MLGFWTFITLVIGGIIGTIIAKLLTLFFGLAISAVRSKTAKDEEK